MKWQITDLWPSHQLFYIVILICYFIIGLILLPFFQYTIHPDGISYIDIAKNYVDGNIGKAINGYWGPALSWMLVPLLLLGMAPLYAIKLLSLAIGALTIIGIARLSYRFEITEPIRKIIIIFCIPIILFYALAFLTPDLLVLSVLAFFFSIIFDDRYPLTPINGVLCGLSGAIAYLSKSYSLFFFPLCFVLLSGLHYYRKISPDEKRNVLKGLGAGLAVFLIICSLWITLISLKYGGLTISTSGSYNYALVGPESMGHPMLTSGLINPENGTISIWDDPSYLPVQKWSPIGSWANFIFQLNLLLNNTWQSINIIKGFSVLTLPIAILYTILCLYRYKGQVLRVTALYPILSALLFLSGFIIIFVEDRYIWIITILLILMGGELITYVMKSSRNLLKSKDNPNIRYLSILLALLMMISFALGPTMTIQYYMKQNPPTR